jgi:hypothetical protein
MGIECVGVSSMTAHIGDFSGFFYCTAVIASLIGVSSAFESRAGMVRNAVGSAAAFKMS